MTPSAFLFRRRSVRDGKIHLALKDIDARHENTQLIADGKPAAGLPANESSLRRVENIKIVRKRRNVHKTGQEHVRQLEEKSIIPDIDDRRAKDLRIARIELALKELELLHLH